MALNFPETSVSTERLSLHPYQEQDVPALVEMMNDESVIAWLPEPYPYTEADGRRWVHRTAPAQRAAGAGVVFAVGEFLTGRLVGTARVLRTDWRSRCAEVDCLTAPWARGEGYASEALLALARWLFHDLRPDLRLERLELRTAAGNTAAQQVAQKVGCISEGVLRNAGVARHREPDGRWAPVRTDLIVWGLLPEDLEGDDDGADGILGHGTDEQDGAFPRWR